LRSEERLYSSIACGWKRFSTLSWLKPTLRSFRRIFTIHFCSMPEARLTSSISCARFSVVSPASWIRSSAAFTSPIVRAEVPA